MSEQRAITSLHELAATVLRIRDAGAQIHDPAHIRNEISAHGVDFDDPVAARALLAAFEVCCHTYQAQCSLGRPQEAFLQAYNALSMAAIAAAERHATAQPSFTCPRCSRTSHHPDDVANDYCSVCGNDVLPKGPPA